MGSRSAADIYDVAVTINIPVTCIFTGGNGSMSGALNYSAESGGKLTINGSGSLDLIADYLEGTTDNGSGISTYGPITFSGGLRLNIKGSGMGSGIICYWGSSSYTHDRGILFDLSEDVYISGGDNSSRNDYGNGIYLSSGPSSFTFGNTGTGDVHIRGGGENGNGIYAYHTGFSLFSAGKGTFVVNGCGYGDGIFVESINPAAIDLTGMNNDIVLMGGETAPTGTNSRYSSGLYIRANTTAVKLGGNNLLCQGGANGGAGLMTQGNSGSNSVLTIESAGGEVYALGGKGAYGYGLWPNYNGLTVAGNGTLYAYGAYKQAGINVPSGYNLTLTGDITVNAVGGEGTVGFSIPAAQRIIFTGNSPTLSITNNSAANETRNFAAQTSGAWNLTGATFAAGSAGDTNVSISIAPGQTGVIKR
jgi:hypothetical protein